METNRELDVRQLEPGDRHEKIFQLFNSLEVGSYFILINDHDPKPLHYQFMVEKPDEFAWNYLEAGPQVWRVEIQKLKKGLDEETIGEIVNKNFAAAEVFQQYDIDFCCGGQKTLAEACREKHLEIGIVKNALAKNIDHKSGGLNRFDQWEPSFLIDYILQNHHRYLKKEFLELPQYVEKLADVHGASHPELVQVNSVFSLMRKELIPHLQIEEDKLFPQLKDSFKNGSKFSGSVQEIIENTIQEHQVLGNILKKLNQITNNYSVPADGCATYTMVYNKLKELETDLHQHIHLENNLLFKQA